MIKCLGYRAAAPFVAVAAAWMLAIAIAGRVNAQPAAADEGVRIFKSANCIGCHKWSGEGGGSYGGAAANLRQTSLTLEQIQETIRCGRPMTGMPYFEADAYADGRCNGLKKSDLQDGQMPPEPDHPLRPADIKLVASYVANAIKGKGAPDYGQCQAFFGTGSRVCNIYAKPVNVGSPAVATSDTAPAQARSQVDRAADANATGKTP